MFAVVAKYSVFPVQEYYADIQKKTFYELFQICELILSVSRRLN